MIDLSEFYLSHEETIAMMHGCEPPDDARERKHYMDALRKKLHQRYTTKRERAIFLLTPACQCALVSEAMGNDWAE